MNTSFAICSNSAISVLAQSFWQTEGHPTYQSECILPKGEVEIIFSFGDSIQFQRNDADAATTPRCFVNGMSSMPLHLSLPRYQSFFGIVLQPVAVKKLFKAPSGTFLNTVTDMELLDKRYSSLWHQLAACTTFHERTAVAERWLLSNVCNFHQQEHMLSAFLTSNDDVDSVSALASNVCYSTRQLHRKVKEMFGMSTEVLLGYKRYRKTLFQLHNSHETLTRIAYDCGYYDQAHFNREFKNYTGLTPGDYRAKQSRLPGHIYQ